MPELAKLAEDPRVTVRRAGTPNPEGTCVVYWMQRAQRGYDNPALDVAVAAANELNKPAVVFFAPAPSAKSVGKVFLNDIFEHEGRGKCVCSRMS
jgi:deoxyribodipyrimidine photo-lyase